MPDSQKDHSTEKPIEALHLEKGDDVSSVSSKANEGRTPQEEERDWSPEEERALVKKLDFRVFPMLCIVFGLSLLDRTNISTAYIAGLSEDLDLAVGSRYSIALLVFFVGYVIFELPSTWVIRRLGAQLWLSFLIISWGLIVLCTGFVHSWKTLTVCRALLGVFEAGLFPGAVYIIGSWYQQYETARRVSLFYMASLLASGFGPILAYALSLIRVGNGDFRRGWRWIFIIEGIFTVVAGLVAPFFLVEFPERAKWLTPRQKHIASARLVTDKKAREYVHPTLKESMKMLLDWKLMIYSLQYFVCASSVYSLAYFKPIILRQGMGFSYAMSQVLASPPYVFAIIMSLMMAWVSDKYRTRWTVLCAQSLTAIVGLLIVLYAEVPGVRYFGLYLAVFGTQANVPGTLSYGQSNTADVRKKGIVAGMWATIAMQLTYSVSTFGLSMYLKRQNKLADEGKRPALENVEGFRYAP